jgi:hypothetical protein
MLCLKAHFKQLRHQHGKIWIHEILPTHNLKTVSNGKNTTRNANTCPKLASFPLDHNPDGCVW